MHSIPVQTNSIFADWDYKRYPLGFDTKGMILIDWRGLLSNDRWTIEQMCCCDETPLFGGFEADSNKGQ